MNELAEQCHRDSIRWFGDMNKDNIVHHTLALCGEAGELANIVKKIDRGSLDYRDPAVRVHIASEMADILTYLLNLSYLTGVDLERAYLGVRASNEIRFMRERRLRDERRAEGAVG